MTRTDLVGGVSTLRGGGALKDLTGCWGRSRGGGDPRSPKYGKSCWWRGRPNQERSSNNCAPAGTETAEPAAASTSMIANRCHMRVLLGLVINLRRGEFFA